MRRRGVLDAQASGSARQRRPTADVRRQKGMLRCGFPKADIQIFYKRIPPQCFDAETERSQPLRPGPKYGPLSCQTLFKDIPSSPETNIFPKRCISETFFYFSLLNWDLSNLVINFQFDANLIGNPHIL